MVKNIFTPNSFKNNLIKCNLKLLNTLFCLYCLFLCGACNKDKTTPNIKSNTASEDITIMNIDFKDEDESNIFIQLQLQEEFALTLAQFKNQFNDYLLRTGLKKRINNNEIPKTYLEEFKKTFLLQLINEELIYQEGLRNPEIKISPEMIESHITKETLRIIRLSNLTFEQFLDSIHMSQFDFSLKLKKDLFRKEVIDSQMKYMKNVTPSEIEELYQKLVNAGRFSEKFREVYIIEYPSNFTKVTPQQIEEIKDLDAFQTIARSDSIHESKKNGGLIEIVPFARRNEQKNNKKLISNLLYDQIWKTEAGTTTYHEINERPFLIWVNKEFEKQTYLSQEVQMYLTRIINNQNKVQIEQNLTLKIATSALFKIRYKNELTPIDLKKFFKNSIAEIQKSNQ